VKLVNAQMKEMTDVTDYHPEIRRTNIRIIISARTPKFPQTNERELVRPVRYQVFTPVIVQTVFFQVSTTFNIVTDLLSALLGNGSVNTFQYTRHTTVEVFPM
jgi:hypothetical protein